jgi:hypothetical protein
MRFLFVAFMACLAVSALAARSFTPEDNAAFSKDYNVCKKASESAAPGGWSFMTEAEVKKNKASDKVFRFGSSMEMVQVYHLINQMSKPITYSHRNTHIIHASLFYRLSKSMPRKRPSLVSLTPATSEDKQTLPRRCIEMATKTFLRWPLRSYPV